ncbi:MAG: UDP-3-O-acyl-N-acetylglucosamine deacetylase, partial [Rhodovibrionaceae bacterium]
RMTLQPAPADSGIVFRRNDLPGQPQLRATLDKARANDLALTLAAGALRIERVELLLAALAGCGIDNAVIELDGPEPPELDGSAAAFAFLIGCAGRQQQKDARKVLTLTRPLRLSAPGRYALLRPGGDARLRLRAAGQCCEHRPGEDDFARSLAPARRAWEEERIVALRRRGLLRGWREDRALTLHDGRLYSPQGLRFADESLRHDLCRALGALSLLGGPWQGTLLLRGASLGMILRLLRRLLNEEDSHAWRALPEPPQEDPLPQAAQPPLPGLADRPLTLPRKAGASL